MKNLLVIKTLLLAGALALAGCSQQKSKPFAQNDSSRWIRVNDAATAQAQPEGNPKINPETFLATGRLMESQGNMIEAARTYHQACLAKPDYVAAWNRLGIMCDKLGRYNQAKHAFSQAIKHSPDTAFLRNNLGFSCLLAGDYEEAEEHLRKALKINKKFQRARVNLGIALGKQGQYDQALKEFKRALPDAQAYYNLAYVHRLNHNWQQAGDCYTQALELDPNLSDAQTGLALCDKQFPDLTDIETEPIDAGPELTDVQPEQAEVQADPTDTELEPVDIETEPEDILPEPVGIETQPEDTQAEPINIEAEDVQAGHTTVVIEEIETDK